MDQQYSNREIDEHFDEIKDILGRIETQTIKTNSRVAKLENWRSYLVGAGSVIMVFGVPLLVYIFNTETGQMESIAVKLNNHINGSTAVSALTVPALQSRPATGCVVSKMCADGKRAAEEICNDGNTLTLSCDAP